MNLPMTPTRTARKITMPAKATGKRASGSPNASTANGCRSATRIMAARAGANIRLAIWRPCFLTESRISARSKQLDLGAALNGAGRCPGGARVLPRQCLAGSGAGNDWRRAGGLAGFRDAQIKGVRHQMAGLVAAMRDGRAEAAAGGDQLGGCPMPRPLPSNG